MGHREDIESGARKELRRKDLGELLELWDKSMPDQARALLLDEFEERSYRIKSLPPQSDRVTPIAGQESAEPSTLEEEAATATFRNPVSLGRALIICLALVAVASSVGVYALVNQNAVLSDLAEGVEKTDAELEANDILIIGSGFLGIATYFVTVIVYLAWIYRVSANQRPLGASRVKYSPGWAIGGWFVPFLNLVRPYQVVREIWDNSSALATRSETSGRQHPSAPATLVGFWWACWLIDNAFSRISARMWPEGEDIESLQRATSATTASTALTVLSAIAAALVVHRITTWQSLARDPHRPAVSR